MAETIGKVLQLFETAEQYMAAFGQSKEDRTEYERWKALLIVAITVEHPIVRPHKLSEHRDLELVSAESLECLSELKACIHFKGS